MQLNHLLYFYEVAKAQSFTVASAKLRVSQPSVSKIVGILEGQLETSLFDRSSRRMLRLTARGQRLLESCEKIFGELERVTADLSRAHNVCSGELAIGASDNVCNYILPGALKSFCKSHGAVVPKIFGGTSGAILAELLSARVELAIFYTPIKDARIELRELGFIEFWLIVPPGTKKLDGSLPFIGSRNLDYKTPYPALQMLSQLGLDTSLGKSLEANLQETQKRLVMEGLGYSVVPAHLVRDEARRGCIGVIPTKKKVGTPLLMATKKGRPLSDL